MFKYRAIRPCFYNGKLYQTDELIITDAAIDPLPSSIEDVTPVVEVEVGVLFNFIKSNQNPSPVKIDPPVQAPVSIAGKILNFFKGN